MELAVLARKLEQLEGALNKLRARNWWTMVGFAVMLSVAIAEGFLLVQILGGNAELHLRGLTADQITVARGGELVVLNQAHQKVASLGQAQGKMAAAFRFYDSSGTYELAEMGPSRLTFRAAPFDALDQNKDPVQVQVGFVGLSELKSAYGLAIGYTSEPRISVAMETPSGQLVTYEPHSKGTKQLSYLSGGRFEIQSSDGNRRTTMTFDGVKTE